MNRTQIINYQGKNIFVLDFTNLSSIDEINSVAEEAKEFIHMQAPSSLFTITNIEGMHFNNQIKDIFLELAKSNKPYVKAGAVVGVSGMKQIIFNGIMKLTGRDLKSFSTVDQAKNWLIAQN